VPAELWREAVRLAHEHGVAAVARGTGLSYASIKQRRETDAPGRAAGAAAPAAFVELRGSALLGAARGGDDATEVELTDAQGVRLRVHFGACGPSTRELGALLESLWSRRR
jgi:hypothetical protein